jgi:hypothetical protein
MNAVQIEARIKALEEQNKAFQKENKNLQKKVAVLEDIEAINKLETAYSFFLEHLLVDEIADCWTEDGVMEWLGLGRFIGREEIRRQWSHTRNSFHKKGDALHPGPRYCGYVTIDPDGKTASGRWYVSGTKNGMEMLCENKYRKEDGVWKYSLLSVGAFPMDFKGGSSATSAVGSGGEKSKAAPPPGPMTPEQEEKMTQDYMGHYKFNERISRCPRQEDKWYSRPFSFKHPVTGKDVNKTVAAHNMAHPCTMLPGAEKWLAEGKKKK